LLDLFNSVRLRSYHRAPPAPRCREGGLGRRPMLCGAAGGTVLTGRGGGLMGRILGGCVGLLRTRRGAFLLRRSIGAKRRRRYANDAREERPRCE
jgi:hypothetical protein